MALSCGRMCSVHHRCEFRGYIDWLLEYPTVATAEAVCQRTCGSQSGFKRGRGPDPLLCSYRLRPVLSATYSSYKLKVELLLVIKRRS